jgi:hypothetical protein
MIRQIASVAIALMLLPSAAAAQTAEFTVKTASAAIHKGPSTGSPIIGKAPRGVVLEVTRELGDWVKVSWPEGEDGVGYVHVSFGTLAPGLAARSPMTAPASPDTGAASAAPAQAVASAPATSSRTIYVPPPTHVVGVGGLMAGSTPAFGATARVWAGRRFGVQVEASRLTETPVEGAARMTSFQLMPSLVYSIADVVTDYVWVRPYVGGGVNFARSSLGGVTPDGGGSVTESALAYRGHGGAELTFASLPRFAVSADVGYQQPKTPFPGYEIGGMGFTIAAHWYVK